MKTVLNDNTSKKLFNNNDYLPRRFGLNFSPPQISNINNNI